MYKKYDLGFIGDIYNSTEINFTRFDSKTRFLKSLNQKSNNWIYRNSPITYKFNSLGHRNNKEINELDLNYILFTGCSHTMGVALHKENIYTSVLSKILNIDHYNLGLGASGWDTICYNLKTWITTIQSKPKLICINWSNFNRYLEDYDTYFIEQGPWSPTFDIDYVESEEFRYKQFESRSNIINLCNSYSIPYIEITCSNDSELPSEIIKLSKSIDLARDDSHFGNNTHYTWAMQILSMIKF